MKRPELKDLTLRQKLGQTGMPSPRQLLDSVTALGGYEKYFARYPFNGVYLWRGITDHTGYTPPTPEDSARYWKDVSDKCGIPLFITVDAEYGAQYLFDSLHMIPTMMSLGAANDGDCAYWRSYYYARELKACGVNWAFSPVCDMASHLLSPGVTRCLSDSPDSAVSLLPEILRGYRDAGVASTVKHYPGSKGDYRDSHFTANTNKMTREEWDSTYRKIWQAAVDADAPSIMVSHCALPCVDDSYAKGKLYRPSTTSAKVIGLLRNEMGFRGVIVSDAVSMKGLSAAFEHDDIYIECFNAGNDIVLFCGDDYLDVMEKAVLDGRVSMERVDESVERILDLKESLGLFRDEPLPEPLTEAENRDFEQKCRVLSSKAITLVNNLDDMLPMRKQDVKNAVIIKLAPREEFLTDLQPMADAFAAYGIHADLLDGLKSKEHLKALSETYDLILYASYMAQDEPQGMMFYSRPEDLKTLISALSYGADKSVVVSFGTPSVYFNYFEQSNAFISAYSRDAETMKAVVDGILGITPFVGKSPIKMTL